MPHMPVLRVVPLERVRRHEDVDPMRVDRLRRRIAAEGVQVNPMICTEAPGGELILLDGATRTEALRALGLDFAAIQLVQPSDVTLETWHHVLLDCESDEILGDIASSKSLSIVEPGAAPRIHTPGGPSWSVVGSGISPNAALTELVATYVGRCEVGRVSDPSAESVSWRYPHRAAVVEFPSLSVEDVMRAAVGNDLLPAGITRFLVNERALRLNVDLSLLTSAGTLEGKQDALDALLEARATAGRVRRYEEIVYILDE